MCALASLLGAARLARRQPQLRRLRPPLQPRERAIAVAVGFAVAVAVAAIAIVIGVLHLQLHNAARTRQ